jgi:hypothetical protein
VIKTIVAVNGGFNSVAWDSLWSDRAQGRRRRTRRQFALARYGFDTPLL